MSAVHSPAVETNKSQGLGTSLGLAVRLLVGWCFVVIGVFDLIAELDWRPGAAEGRTAGHAESGERVVGPFP